MKRTSRLIWAAAGGYLLGTTPSAEVACRLATGGSVDLRRSGSGNPGGMNARHVLGRRVGVAVMAADIAKGDTFPAYAPVDVALATAVARVPGLRRPALVSVAVSSTAWLLASVVGWKRSFPNLWRPRSTAALPLANAATVLLIASRAVVLLRRREPDELALPR